MTFRSRIALSAAVAVAAAVVVASIVVMVVVNTTLRDQVDRTMTEMAQQLPEPSMIQVPGPVAGEPVEFDLVGPSAGSLGVAVVLDGRGDVIATTDAGFQVPLDVEAGDEPAFTDVEVEGSHLRVMVSPVGSSGQTLVLARSVDDIDATLQRLRWLLLLIAGVGIAVAAGLGLVVSRAAIGPVRELTETTERVSATGDLAVRIEVEGDDEVARLASSFNAMLAALETSVGAQRQLVADASHEFRTPITSARTNIELLQRSPALPEDERRRILTDVVRQLEELSVLVNDVVDLARGGELGIADEPVALDQVVRDAIERTKAHATGAVFETDLTPATVHGDRALLVRAIGNLTDNAAAWSPPGAPIEVTLRPGLLEVRDHGPGLDDGDLAHVFDRFYRSPAARGRPGSGLGLAIVRQTVEAHGGSVQVSNDPGGGARFTVKLPNS